MFSIERLWKETCGSVRDQHTVSPNERKFLKEYGGLIEKATQNFRDCCNPDLRVSLAPGVMDPQDFWQPFDEVLKLLMNATGRREHLPLHDISPAMASTVRQLALTNMPGAISGNASGHTEPVTIHRVDSSVAILRTKTKPKSLEFIGSDGETYKYLLKAREDLRLDERIMQFLRVTNDFLRADNAAAARDLSAQSYSVIPISRNAGLIQMVPDVVPLFQVYTARNDGSGRALQDPASASSALQQPPPPTAQFYAKLKQHGITNVSPSHRAQWPAPVLKQVYQELVAQRPRNVLQQEILLRSDNLRESWTKSARLSKSLAVMSVLGYIVGLGDRHLDNILLCINSGDIVHIDHNVCFDKGRKLKVPEIVPFRLTPMLQDALGFTGVEGRFRVAFETTLRVVRSDYVREALLTLLEAFVYNPLADWIVEDKRQDRSGDLKARLEVNVNLSLFLSRAEERRQDTIAFGRQYDQCADAISRVFKGADVSFVALLEHRKHLLSLEGEENTLLKEAASVEATLATYQSAEQAKRADGERAAAEAKELTAKISSFAKECLARHQQIEMWRQKTITFAETDPDHQLNAVTQAVESTPFQRIHAALCKVLEQPQFTGQQKELVAALGSTCQSVDASVARLRFDITNLATSLIPYLSYYGRQRKELDAYLDLDLEMAYKDVYFKWWNLCSESLRGLVDKQSEEKTDSIVPCSAPSEESVAESTVILRRLSEMHLDPKSLTDGEDDTSSFSRADQLLQDVSNALSTMKLSNAQGQRLMKLAGASWIIKVMEQLNDECCAMNVGSDVPDVLTSTLPASLKYMRVVAVAHACSTLLELVATPKGSMKRLRVSELLIDAQVPDSREERQDTGMNGIIEILQRVGSFAFVVQEEFISNLHARQSHESAGEDLLELIRVIIAAPGGTEDLMNTVLVSSSSSTNDANLSVQQLLAEHPAIHNVFVTAFAVTQKVSLLIDTLQQSLVIAKEEADRMKRFSGAIWIDLVLNFIEQFYGREGGQAMEQVARTIWSAHLNDFLSGCLTKLLQYQLASVISSEWKFDFTAIEPDQDALSDDVEPRILSDRWAIFFSSQMPAIMPSTLVNQSNGTHEIQTRCLSKLLVELMTVCETWWSRHWSKTQANSWAHRISSLRVHHERRLRYAEWLETKSSEDGDPACLSRVQLLAFLSSQVPYLNVLLTDQAAVEASVLELAQQMDYAASTLSVSSAELESADESLHVSIQSCYAKMTGLFDYGRTLVDLVQGISIIETSSGESMPGTEKVELEVDIAGKTFLQAASKTTLEMQSSGETLNEMTTRVQALQDEVKQKRGVYNNLLLRKRDVENVFHSFCLVNKSVVLENARVLSKHVKELRCLMRGFDKLKTPAKQAQLATGSEQRSSLSLERPSSNTTAAFSFMENDRLVRILLRSIRSVNHLQLLESVLERHGEVCVSLREAIAHLDQVLRGFDARFDQLLSDNGHAGINGQESPRAYLLLQLLLDLIEALQVVKTDIPQPRAPNISEVGTREDASASLLVVGRDLLRGCVKLFFEATEMADRLSSTADANRSASEATTLLGEDGEADEESGVADSSADLESGNCAVLAVNSDSGSSSHDTAASTPRSVEEKSQYGLQVLKRIEEKLSGTMAESEHVSQVLTVEQQASWLIDEATKTDNLCVMYEGWTPWI